MTEESKIVRGCWISHPTIGDAVVTAVRSDGWLWTRTEAVSESTGDKVWSASAVLLVEATFLREPDDESRVILAKRGAYGTDLVDPREAEIDALREQLEDARTRLRAAEAQAEHFKAEGVFQERRAKRAEERAARLEEKFIVTKIDKVVVEVKLDDPDPDRVFSSFLPRMQALADKRIQPYEPEGDPES
jgi:hypothetical protein